MSGERVHLLDLRERVSASGNRYLSGWLGKASVVAFPDRDADEPTWNVFVSTPAPRPDGSNANALPADRSPFTPQSSRPRGPKRSMRPGELDDDLADL